MLTTTKSIFRGGHFRFLLVVFGAATKQKPVKMNHLCWRRKTAREVQFSLAIPHFRWRWAAASKNLVSLAVGNDTRQRK
jgi:hypothetical protein